MGWWDKVGGVFCVHISCRGGQKANIGSKLSGSTISVEVG